MNISRRLFWRIYLNGLLLLIVVAAAGTLLAIFVPVESRYAGRAEQLSRFLTLELSRHAPDLEVLQPTLDLLAQEGINSAIYRLDGQPIALAGDIIPRPLGEKEREKIGRWHPLRQKQWVHAIALETTPPAYLLLSSNTPAHGSRFLLTLATVFITIAVVSFPLARALTRPLEQLTQNARQLAMGNLRSRSGIVRNDEVGELARALDDMAGQLEERIQRERELFANISHEIRTPLARLRVALELCEEVPGNVPQTMARLKEMEADIRELDHLVSSVLGHTRRGEAPVTIDSFPLRRHFTDLSGFLADVVQRFQRHHPHDSLHFLQPQFLPAASIDPEMMHRVCQNLLDNAVKYRASGTPIRLHAEVQEGYFFLSVCSTGNPVPEADLPHLFRPFFRSHKEHPVAIPGTGLGLALCRRIVEAHGGVIEARRDAGGMEFLVKLPLTGRSPWHATEAQGN